MGDYKRSGGSRGSFGGGSRGGFGGGRGGRPSFGGSRGGFSGGDRGDRPEMHKATCSECKETCEVPFRPTGEKPVYCSKCFGDRGGSASQDRGGRRDFGRREEPRFAPRHDRESSGGSDDMKKQFSEINSKLDTLIRLLGSKE